MRDPSEEPWPNAAESPGSSPVNPSISRSTVMAWSHTPLHPIGSTASKVMCFTPKSRREATEQVMRELGGCSAPPEHPNNPISPLCQLRGATARLRHGLCPIPSPGWRCSCPLPWPGRQACACACTRVCTRVCACACDTGPRRRKQLHPAQLHPSHPEVRIANKKKNPTQRCLRLTCPKAPQHTAPGTRALTPASPSTAQSTPAVPPNPACGAGGRPAAGRAELSRVFSSARSCPGITCSSVDL